MGVVVMEQSVSRRRLSAERTPALFVTRTGSDCGKWFDRLTNYNTPCFSTPLVTARRSYMLRHRLPGPYEDRVGPVVLTVLLCLSILVNMTLKLVDIFSAERESSVVRRAEGGGGGVGSMGELRRCFD